MTCYYRLISRLSKLVIAMVLQPLCCFYILYVLKFASETTNMKKHFVLLSVMLFLQAASVSVFAQDKPKYEYVDLGLSVKWATCNVGADKPEDYGDYYAWGETEPKDFYFWSTYKYCDASYKTLTKYTDSACGKDGFSDDKSVLDPEDDVAHVKWGGNWRIPTKDELEELRTKCTWTSTTLNGVKGYSVTSNVDGYTDRSIFLPATGMRIRQWTLNTDTIGRFWGNSIEIEDDSDEAVYLDFNFSRGPGRFSIVRCFGQCVRPVCTQEEQIDSTVNIKVLTPEMLANVKSCDMSHEEYAKLIEESIEFEYVIEIGKISKKTRARREDKENYTKKTYKVPDGITFKELIFSLPGAEKDKSGRLITKERKKIVSSIYFNSQLVLGKDLSRRYYTDDTKLKSAPFSANDFCSQIFKDDTKLNGGTVFVQIKQCIYNGAFTDESEIIIEYFQNVSNDKAGGNSEYVDLGLSVKWSSRNVGAEGPQEIGDFYSWKKDDIAHAKLGGSWRMPTTDELNELIDNCTWSWASVNGQIGFLVTSNKRGYKDRSIFLPYFYAGSSGDLGYWSSSFDESSPDGAASLWINVFENYVRAGSCYRSWKLPVRPVCP